MADTKPSKAGAPQRVQAPKMAQAGKASSRKPSPKPSPAADEKLFTIPLRKEWLKAPLNKRARRSINTIRAFLSRHMKIPETEIKISAKLNNAIWFRGAGKPPSKMRIKASFDAEAGLLHAVLPDEELSPRKEKEKPKKTKEEETKAGIKETVEKVLKKAADKEEVKKTADKPVTAETQATKSPAGTEAGNVKEKDNAAETGEKKADTNK